MSKIEFEDRTTPAEEPEEQTKSAAEPEFDPDLDKFAKAASYIEDMMVCIKAYIERIQAAYSAYDTAMAGALAYFRRGEYKTFRLLLMPYELAVAEAARAFTTKLTQLGDATGANTDPVINQMHGMLVAQIPVALRERAAAEKWREKKAKEMFEETMAAIQDAVEEPEEDGET